MDTMSIEAINAIKSLTFAREEITLKLNLLYFQIDRLNELIQTNAGNVQKIGQFGLKIKELEAEKDMLNHEYLENQIAQQDIEASEAAIEEDQEDQEEEDQEEDQAYANGAASEAANEAAEEAAEEDEECPNCEYEWHDGFNQGWQKAMEYFEKNIKKTVVKTLANPPKICSNCNVDECLSKCDGTCNGAEYYCSKECQKEHWKEIH